MCERFDVIGASTEHPAQLFDDLVSGQQGEPGDRGGPICDLVDEVMLGGQSGYLRQIVTTINCDRAASSRSPTATAVRPRCRHRSR